MNRILLLISFIFVLANNNGYGQLEKNDDIPNGKLGS